MQNTTHPIRTLQHCVHVQQDVVKAGVLQLGTVTRDGVLVPDDGLVDVGGRHQVLRHVAGAALLEVRDVVLVGQHQEAEHVVRAQRHLAAVDVSGMRYGSVTYYWNEVQDSYLLLEQGTAQRLMLFQLTD